MVNDKSKIIINEEIGKDIFFMCLLAPEIAYSAKPGQFITIRCSDGYDAFLRRPISICDVNKEKGYINIVYQLKGRGTGLLAQMKKDEYADILGPLGYNGFTVDSGNKRAAIIGGGIGVFPLMFLAKECRAAGVMADGYLGFRNKEAVVMEELFRQECSCLQITTDDGSYAGEGLVTVPLLETMETVSYDIIYACGPAPMLKAVAEICHRRNIECEISVEQRMGCGIGACLVCTCKTKDDTGDEIYSHVCKDGPVFKGDRLLFT